MYLFRALNDFDMECISKYSIISCNLFRSYLDVSTKEEAKKIMTELVNTNITTSLDRIIGHINGKALEHSCWISTSNDLLFTLKEYAIPQSGTYNIDMYRKNVAILEFDESDMINLDSLDFKDKDEYEKMYSKYQNKFKNPVLLGYLVHLLTDYYFNNYIYENYFIKDDNGKYIGYKKIDGSILYCDFREANRAKQEDFKKFNDSITVRKNNFRFCLNSKYFSEIDELKLDKKEIYAVGKYLDSSHSKMKNNTNYQILTKDEMDILVKNCIQFIFDYLEKKQVI